MVVGHNWCVRIALALLLSAAATGAGAIEYNRLSLSNEAIDGFDAVAYWQGGQPTQGSRAYSYEWRDAVWLFSNEANLQKFRAAPERYAPAFGGYCAFAMTKGIKADIHPYFYKIEDKQLFFFFSAESRDKFLADPHALNEAENAWREISTKNF
ncbi:MAG TPA: YHS domain-containing (seleno)protein [Alphaproteobacteria bacterium]|nr:YHS domain-containing (seleno)protein [Alphaproteobacteria bacterium]